MLEDHADDADADILSHFVDDPRENDLACWLECCLEDARDALRDCDWPLAVDPDLERLPVNRTDP